MATKKGNPKEDARKGQKRFVDQPGQWTPGKVSASTKRKQEQAWKKLEASLKKKKK